MESKLYCNNCGAEYDESIKFCRECGAQQDALQQPPQSYTVQSAMQQPVPPIYPAIQPQKSGFGKGMLLGCLIPVVLFIVLAVVGFLLFNSLISGFFTDYFSNMPTG